MHQVYTKGKGSNPSEERLSSADEANMKTGIQHYLSLTGRVMWDRKLFSSLRMILNDSEQ